MLDRRWTALNASSPLSGTTNEALSGSVGVSRWSSLANRGRCVFTTSARSPLSIMTVSQMTSSPPSSRRLLSVFLLPQRCRRAKPIEPTRRSPTPIFSALAPVSTALNSRRISVIMAAMALDDSVDPRIASRVDKRACDTLATDASVVDEKWNVAAAKNDAEVTVVCSVSNCTKVSSSVSHTSKVEKHLHFALTETPLRFFHVHPRYGGRRLSPLWSRFLRSQRGPIPDSSTSILARHLKRCHQRTYRRAMITRWIESAAIPMMRLAEAATSCPMLRGHGWPIPDQRALRLHRARVWQTTW